MIQSMNLQKGTIYDAHIHLSDFAYEPIRTQIMASMSALDIVAFCVSTSVKDSIRTLHLGEKSNRIATFVGIHPDNTNDDPKDIARLVDENCVCGIGEIGLDPTVTDHAGYKKQLDVFEVMLLLAEQKELPISIHSRKCLDDVLDIISAYKIRSSLLHWFDGNKRQLSRAMDRGLYVSYGPVAVYAKDKQSLISRTIPSQLLVETDGPVRFSRCFDQKIAQPCHITSVINCVAHNLDMSYNDMTLMLAENSQRYIKIDR